MSNNYMGGIYLYSSCSNNITSNTASHNWYYGSGIYLNYSSNNTLTDNTASDNFFGIYLEDSSDNTLSDNNGNLNKIFGIYLWSSSHNTLTNNTANSNCLLDVWPHPGIGIELYQSSYNELKDNIANWNCMEGIRLHSSSNYNTLTSNTASHNNYDGIYLWSSNNNALVNNNANSNNESGIYLYLDSNNNYLINNTVSENKGDGFKLESNSSHNRIIGNNASDNDKNGIRLYGTIGNPSSHNTVANNTADLNDKSGIMIEGADSDHNTIVNNTCKSNDYGISVRYGDYNNLTKNTCNQNSEYGIRLYQSADNNEITNNTAISNTEYGIYISSSDYNIIYNNYFNNTNNAYDDRNNVWNTTKTLGTNIIGGPYLGGNYWSDYAGRDINGDGLGDTFLPYNSNGNITNGGDYHPLVPEGSEPLLSIEKTDNPDPVQPGGTLSYSISVNNIGYANATNVTVTETYDENVTFVSVVPAPSQGNDTWVFATLNVSETKWVNISVAVNASVLNGTVLHNIVNVTCDEGVTDSDTENTTVFVAPVPVLGITKTDAPDPVSPGGTLNYSISVNNTGNATATNVTVMETYDGNVTFVTAVPAPSPGNDTWVFATLNVSEMRWINISVSVNASVLNGTVLHNIVNVTCDEGVTDSDTENTTVFVAPVPVLEIAKTDAPDPVSPGGTLNYTISVNNTGNATATNVTVMETYDENVTFVEAVPAPSSGDDTWQFATLNVSETRWINISVTVNASVPNGTVLYNSVTVTCAEGVSDTDTENTTVFVAPVPVLEITKTDAPDPVLAGSTLNYTISVNNTGNATATNVTVMETYDENVTFVEAVPAPSSGDDTWQFPTLNASETRWINISVSVNASVLNGTVLHNIVNVSCDEGVTDSDTEDTTVLSAAVPILEINKTDNPDPVSPGGTLNYTISVNNTGNATATNVTVMETYDKNVTFVTAVPAPSSGDDTWQFPTLNANETKWVNISVLVNASVLNGTVLHNFVNVTCAEGVTDSDTENTTVFVAPVPVLEIIKTDNPDPVSPGGTLNYTICVNNTGNATATNVTVTEAYDGNVTFVSAVPAPSLGNDTWKFATLNVSETRWINISVIVNASVLNGTVLHNIVNVTCDEGVTDADTENTTVFVAPVPVLEITKTDVPDPVSHGGTLNYTIAVNNTGNATATNLTVMETYDGNVTYVAAVPAPSSGDGTWQFPTLNVSETRWINISVTVNASVPNGTVLHNIVNVTCDEGASDSDTENTTVFVAPVPVLEIAKTDAPDPVSPGGTLNYTISVNNTGNATATNVTVMETYDKNVTFGTAVPAPSQGNDTWQFPTLNASEMRWINVSVTVNASVLNGTVLHNIVNVSCDEGVTDSDTENTTVFAMPSIQNVKISKWVKYKTEPDREYRKEIDDAKVCNNVSFKIAVQNNGTGTNLTGISVTDVLNCSLGYIEGSASIPPTIYEDNCPENQTFIWQFPGIWLEPGKYINITFDAHVDEWGNDTNYARVKAENETGHSVSDEDTVWVNCTPPGTPVETATGTGTAYFATDAGTIEDLVAINESTLPAEGKPPLAFPHGFFSFNITGLIPGQTVVVTITLPDNVPVGTEYWKYHASEGGWIRIPMGSDDGDKVITITLVDGGLGDDDGTADGVIVDQGGPGTRGAPPNITSFAPPSPVNDTVCNWRTFNVTVNQTVNVSWYLNNTLRHTDASTKEASYTLHAEVVGEHNVSAIASNENGTDMQMWVWNVTAAPLPVLEINKTDNPDPVSPGGTLNYFIRVNNTGNATATNVTVMETYDGNVTFVTAVPAPSQGNDTWQFTSLNVSETRWINISVIVNASVLNGTVLHNIVNVTCDEGVMDSDTENTTVFAAQVLSCTCGDICVNETGWWRDGGNFNASGTPIQHAIDNATAGEEICVKDGTYNENVDVNKRLTIRSENGTANCVVKASNPNDHVFDVTADYVNISGFTATGATGDYKAGIYLASSNHCNISDNNAYNNYHGIYLYSSSNNNLSGNYAYNNSYYGIFLYSSSNYNNLSGNNAYNNTWHGIVLYDLCNYNNLSGNYAYNNSCHGISLSHSSNNNNLSGNYAYNNTYHGIVLYELCNNNNLSGNYAYNNSCHGISLSTSSNYNNLSGNYAYNNSYDGIALYNSSNNNNLSGNYAYNNSRHGISMNSSSNNNLSGNYAYDNSYDGIALYNLCNNNNLSGNYAYDNSRHGISLSTSSNYNTLTSNTANSNNDYGICLQNSSNNNLTNNTAQENNRFDLHILASSDLECKNKIENTTGSGNRPIGYYNDSAVSLADSTFSELILCNADHSDINNVTIEGSATKKNNGVILVRTDFSTLSNINSSNNYEGFWLHSSSHNTLTNNTASNNYRGIYLDVSSSNLIYNNYFNNTNNAYDNRNNVWNTTKTLGTNIIGGPYLGGNYWSDYAGRDINGDGLGDTLLPYNSSGGITNGGDYHPLVPGCFEPLLSIEKSDNPDPVSPGGTLNYTIRVNNTGNATATNVTVIETYDGNVTFVSAVPVPSLGNDTWKFATLNVSETKWVNISVLVNASVPNGTVLHNIVNVTCDEGVMDSDTENTTVFVAPVPVLEITKTDNPDPVSPGGTLNYTISVNNTGNATATNVTVMETYDGDVTFVTAVPAPSQGNDTWQFATLNASETRWINVSVTVNASVLNGTVLHNIVNVTCDEGVMDSDTENTTVFAAHVLNCTCGDICVNTTGWWRAGGNFNASGTPIQHAIDNATAGEEICVKDGTYNENVDVNKRLTIRSENGTANCVVNASNSNDHVFDVTADYVNISGFTATGATGDYKAGIYLGSSNHCNISDNNAYNNYHGIYLYSSSNNNLSGNYAYNNSGHGIRLRSSSNNNLSGNYAYNNSGNGIRLQFSSNYNNLSGNYAYNNTWHGIVLYDLCNNNNLSGNYAYNNSCHGISLSTSSNYNNLSGNYGYNNSYDGIALYNSSNYNNLSGNYAYNNSRHGISLSSSSNYNTLTENTANSNDRYGIFLNDADDNTLTSNIANSNNDHGINLTSSNNNIIYNNYFNNTNNAHDDGNNIWNVTKTPGTNIIGGPYLGGNYWSDYVGADTDADGLGNTLLPYNSSGDIANGGDWHPLVPVGFGPALSIEKSDSPDPVPPGGILNYTISVNNTGNATATNVTVIEAYDENVTFVSAVPAPSLGNDTWKFATLNVSETRWINLSVIVNASAPNGTVLHNVVNVTCDEGVSDSDTEDTTVLSALAPVLEINKTGVPDPVSPGGTLNYSISVNNTGNATATNVTVTETYDGNVTFVSAVPAPSQGNDTWKFATLNASETRWVNISVIVNASVLNGTVLHNVVNVTCDEGVSDSDTENTTVFVALVPALEINKTGVPDPVSPGGTLNYTIHVNNTSNATATNVTVTETYDENVTFVAALPAPSLGNDTWKFATLNANETKWVNISVLVNASVLNGTVLHNIVNVTCDEGAMDSDTENTTVFVAPVLNCTCGDICVNTFGWWRDGGAFNPSKRSIQDAIGNAIAGDTICVKDGTYYENVVVTQSHLTIRSENGPSVTTVSAFLNSDKHVFDITDQTNVTLEGFEIRDAHNDAYQDVAGIYMYNASECNISGNIVTDISTTGSGNDAYGIYLHSSSDNSFDTSTVYNLDANDGDAYGIRLLHSSNNSFSSSTSVYNISSANYSAYGIYLRSSSDNSFYTTTVYNISSANHDAYGIRLLHSSNNSFSSSTSVYNISSANYSAYGIYLRSSSDNNSFYTSTSVYNISSAGYNAYGIYLHSSSDNSFYTSTVYNLSAIYDAYGIYLRSSSDNSFYTSTVYNISSANHNAYGIYLHSSSDNNSFRSGSISDLNVPTWWDFYSDASSHGNSAEDITISSHPTTISFTYENGIMLKSVRTPPADPAGKRNISKFVTVTEVTADSWIFMNVSYEDGDLGGVDENSLRMWKHNGTDWTEVPGTNGVNTAENYVYANITEFSVFAPLGDGANLEINKTGVPDPVLAGGTLNYSISVNNTGNATATNVTVTETYDGNVTFVTAVPAPSLGNDTWKFATLNASETRWINISIIVNASVPNGTVLHNIVNVSCAVGVTDSDTENTTVFVAPVPALEINKTDNPDPVSPGGTLNYSIRA